MIDQTLLEKGKKYLVGVSFGPDSMALLDMLIKEGYTVHVAHVNYHLRQQSNEEEQGITTYCQKHNLPLYIFHAKEKPERANLQAWARKIRFDFFKTIYQDIKADGLLLGHHLDDYLETILIQKLRKTQVIYYGIKKVAKIQQMMVIRPLLDVEKQDLINHCLQFKVPFAVDFSNLSDKYTRNKIRHQIIEKMSLSDKKRQIKEAAQHNELIEKDIQTINQLISNQIVLVADVLTMNNKQTFYMLYLLINPILPSFAISDALIEKVSQVARSSKKHWQYKLGGGIWLTKSYDHFLIVQEQRPSDYCYIYERPSKDDTPYFYINFIDKSHRNLISNADYPITIRPAKKDDFIMIKGVKRKIFRLFIDWKIPRYKRPFWPIITDKKGQVKFVPRYQKDYVASKDDLFWVK